MFRVRYAEAGDREAWLRMDRHLPEELFGKKVRDRMGYLLTDGGVPVGLLRYSLFWDSIPFLNLLFLLEGSRGKGYGRKLMEYWEERMGRLGCPLVMTSTASDEYAQHFYRRLGYSVVGGFQPEDAPFELILAKKLGSQERM